jgi:large subunit ribosomal protein L17
VAKAKEARRLAERLITFGKRGDVAARRHVDTFVMRPDVTQKLFTTIAPWYAERQGGYTRIVRIGRRLGDAGETAYLELVKSTEQKELERQARIAAAEAKEASRKGDKAEKRSRAEAASAAEGDKPRRGRGKEAGPGTSPAPTKKAPRRSVTTG